MPCFIVLCFPALHGYCLFYKSEACDSHVLAKSIRKSTVFPTVFAHFMSLCQFGNSHITSNVFRCFCSYYIYYGDLGSLISGVTIVNALARHIYMCT